MSKRFGYGINRIRFVGTTMQHSFEGSFGKIRGCCQIGARNSIIKIIDREYPVRFAYLFGSRARGEATADSDTDIALYLTNRYPKSEPALIRGYLIELAKKY